MAGINRFRRVLYQPNTQYYPKYQEQNFIPDLSGLEGILNNLQQQYDASRNYQLPNYLRNSQTDTQAFHDYKNNLENMRQSAIDAFVNKDFNTGQSKLREFADYITNSKRPGGDYYELEKGVTDYNAALKRIQDTYLDQKSNLYNPYIFKYAKDKLDNGIDPFKDPTTGQYRASINGPTLNRYIPQEEVVKQYNEILDNIKADQVVYGNKVPKSLEGVSFKSLLERGETEFIDPRKVMRILANATTPEIQGSYNLLGEAMGIGPQGQFVDPKSGGFSNTMLGKLLTSLTDSKVYRKTTDKSLLVSDSYGEQRKLKALDTLYTASEGTLTAGPDFSMDKMTTQIEGLDSELNKLESRLKSTNNPLSAQELIHLDELKSRKNILEVTKNSYIQSFLDTEEGQKKLETHIKNPKVARFAPIDWLINTNKVTPEELQRYVTDPNSIPSSLMSLEIPALATGSKMVGYKSASNKTTLIEAIKSYREQFDSQAINKYAKNNKIALSANVIQGFNISGNNESNVAGTANKLLSDMVINKGGAFSVPSEGTTIDKLMEDNDITTKKYNISVGILDRRIGGENAYYFKATPKEEYSKTAKNFETYIFPKYDLGLESQIGEGLMQDALGKNKMGNYNTKPPLDLDESSMDWAGNSWKVYEAGRSKYAESQLGSTFKEFSNLEDQGILIPNQDYELYLPGMNPTTNTPLKFRKESAIQTDGSGRRYAGNKFSVLIPEVDNAGNKINIKVSANSISDLMVKLLQDSSNPEVVQEQSSTNIFNNQ